VRQAYRLEAVVLHQIGVFDELRIDFPPIQSPDRDATKAEIHLLTGPNGCGKSTLLYVLAEIFRPPWERGLVGRRFRNNTSGTDFKFAGYGGYYGVRSPDPSPPPFPNMRHSGPFGDYADYQNDPSQGRYFGCAANELQQYKSATANFQPANSHSQSVFSFAAFAYSGQRTVYDVPLGAIQQINNSPFEHALSFDLTARAGVLLQWIANNRAQSALAKADGDLKAAAVYDLALSRISNLIRDICDLDVEFRLDRSPLAVSVKVSGQTIHFDSLPDGLKSIISWVADLSLRLEAIPWKVETDVFSQPVILFLDEVDIHLHPKWQRRILPALQKLLPNAQIFVSTHSPFVVGSVEDAWVYRLPEPGQSGPAIVEAMPSGAGKSYRLILDEIFGVNEEFDVETESLFDDFYAAKEQFIKSSGSPESLLKPAQQLAERGEEAAAIVTRELRQIARITGREISLA